MRLALGRMIESAITDTVYVAHPIPAAGHANRNLLNESLEKALAVISICSELVVANFPNKLSRKPTFLLTIGVALGLR